jgi:hypothetical protein
MIRNFIELILALELLTSLLELRLNRPALLLLSELLLFLLKTNNVLVLIQEKQPVGIT